MQAVIRRPEKCPKCGEELRSIIVEEKGNRLVWNEETGYYEAEYAQVTTYYRCGECGEIVGVAKSNGEQTGLIPEVW